jgi:hypothetical protein
MPRAADKTLADYVVTAISPGLIMALVGSLVFFLVEVLYVGQYQGTLLYIFFLFVFGAVLVSRISMSPDIHSRAALYGCILGGLTWLALLRYVEFVPGTTAAEWGWAINLGLIALIWWSAHRLTWDCTTHDDEEDASGVGVLQAAGLDQSKGKPEQAGPASAPQQQEKKPAQPREKEPALVAWWQRLRRYREAKRRQPRTPGIWVVYFSLAALPLYGLGQSLIPPEDSARRSRAFWLMSVYVASGLGLLLTTCFLGLRRYLRQRQLKMPAAITGVWLLTGTLMIAVFLILGALLPRPSPEVALVDLPWLAGSKDRDASRTAFRGQEPGKGEGKARAEGKAEEDEGGAGKEGQQQVESGKGSGQAESSSGKGGKEPGKGAAKDGEKEQSAQGKNDSEQRPGGGRQGPEKRAGRQGEQRSSGQKITPGSNSLPARAAKLAAILKWVVIAIFALVFAFFVIRALLRFLANFTGWAQRLLDAMAALWQALWRRRPSESQAGAEAEAPRPKRPAPFQSFRNPFLSGQAEKMPVTELVRYSFEALEAWAWERDLPRQPGETPLEFAERITQEVPAMEAEVRELTGYYAGLAYARLALTDECRKSLRQFWLQLTEVVERPLSAGASR